MRMASTSTSRDVDIEAQQDILQPPGASYHLPHCNPLGHTMSTIHGVGLAGNEMREMEIRPLEMKGDSIRASTVSANQKDSLEAGLGVSPATGAASILPPSVWISDLTYQLIPLIADGERETYEPDNHQSGHVGDTRQTPTRIGHDRIQGVAQGQATPGLGPISGLCSQIQQES